jgi:hypothetical protein
LKVDDEKNIHINPEFCKMKSHLKDEPGILELEELFKVNKKFLEDEQKEEDKVSCPWCGNNCLDKFIFKEYTNEPGLGTILCADCYSSFPPGKLKDGEFIFEHNEKLEEYNS